MSDQQFPASHSTSKTPSLAPIIIGCLTAGVAIGLGVGFTLSKSRPSLGQAPAGVNAGVDGNLFTLDGKTYNAQDLPAESRDVVFQIQSQAYDSLSEFTKQLALRVALAGEGGKTVDMKTLPALRDLLAATPPPEEELKKFFEANAKGLPPGTKYEDIKPQIEQFLSNQKSGEAARTKIAELESSKRLTLLLKAPEPRAVDLKIADYPAKGPEGVPVTLVEVADYLCPHCREMEESITETLKENEGKVRFVYVSYPLRPAGLNGYLSKGTYCASKQGADKVWSYREKAYQVPLAAQSPAGEDVKAEFEKTTFGVARDAGLDAAAFETCLRSPEAQAFVDKTIQEMSSAGVTGTPTFFINNKKVSLTNPHGFKDQLKLAIADATQKN